MNFFKDSKHKSIRAVLILLIIIGVGWFTVSNMNRSKSNQGLVINPALAPTPTPTTALDKLNPITTIRYYDSVLNRNVKVSQINIQNENDGPQQGTFTCTGTCTGNGCGVYGCDPVQSSSSTAPSARAGGFRPDRKSRSAETPCRSR